MTRRYLLEQVDDAAVVQYYADGFEALTIDQKILAWHLYQAAIAGRDIYYDQRYRHSLEMRRLLEEALRHPDNFAPEVLSEIRRYTKLFWINSGPYNNLTARKFTLSAKVRDVLTGTYPFSTTFQQLGTGLELEKAFFEADWEPMVTNKTPGAGKDILETSANNFYAGGVTSADLEGFTERYGLNSRLVKRDGKLVEEVYKVGGRYDAQIREIVTHLDAAVPFATEPMAKAIRALAQWYRSGDAADRKAYDIAWVEDKA